MSQHQKAGIAGFFVADDSCIAEAMFQLTLQPKDSTMTPISEFPLCQGVAE